jgi:hypothetical protein
VVIDWVEWSEAEAAGAWDRALLDQPEHSLYQAYGWGEYKRRAGWAVRRGAVLVDGAVAALAQCLVREIRVARLAIVWVPGGPAGTALGRLHLPHALRRRYRGWSLWLRAHVVAERRHGDETAMRGMGWRPASVRVGHALTFRLDLAPDETQRRRALHGNWRHNLARGEERKHDLRVWVEGEPLEAVHAVLGEIAGLKGIPSALGLDDLCALRAALGPAFTLVASIDTDGSPSAVRGFGRLGARAWDLVAATSAAGRRTYASYLVMWRLLEMAHHQGAREYDLSGADPVNAPGVYNFKRGLGGPAVSMLGEWDWTTNRLVGWAADRVVGRRGVTVAAGP